MKHDPINKSDSFPNTCSSIISSTINVFMLILVSVFPLIYHHSYFDILETKYRCYYLSVIAMAAVSAVLALVMLVIDMVEFKGHHAAKLFSALSPHNWKTTFRLGDRAALLFWLAALISTLGSEYLYEAFWGNEGRYSGLFLMTLYVVFYFMVSRFWKVKNYILEIFLVTGMVMCVIGITDYFQMDILHFRENIKPEQSTIFTSTVGNINTYTAYVALIMGVAAGMFSTSKNLWKSVWYFICLVISFFAIIMGCSDNAYLALGAMFVFLPFVLFRDKRGILRYMMILSAFLTVIQCIDYINQAYADIVIGLDSLFLILTNINGLLAIVLFLWIIIAAFYLFGFKNKNTKWNTGNTNGLGNKFVYLWSILMALALLIIIFALYDANIAGNAERYQGLGNYLVFNDQWGTNRGYIWRKSLEQYQGLPFFQKVFGYGPDTFGILTTRKFKFEMINATGQVFDSAHNEYLQFLLTIGFAGAASYIVFLAASCWSMVKNRENNPCSYACAVAVVCYSFQALVNLNLPIATPMMWLLLSIGVSSRSSGKGAAAK